MSELLVPSKDLYCLACECSLHAPVRTSCWQCGHAMLVEVRPKWWPDVNGPRMMPPHA